MWEKGGLWGTQLAEWSTWCTGSLTEGAYTSKRGNCNQPVTREVKETFVPNNGLPADGTFPRNLMLGEGKGGKPDRRELTLGRDFKQFQ